MQSRNITTHLPLHIISKHGSLLCHCLQVNSVDKSTQYPLLVAFAQKKKMKLSTFEFRTAAIFTCIHPHCFSGHSLIQNMHSCSLPPLPLAYPPPGFQPTSLSFLGASKNTKYLAMVPSNCFVTCQMWCVFFSATLSHLFLLKRLSFSIPPALQLPFNPVLLGSKHRTCCCSIRSNSHRPLQIIIA